MDDQQDADRDYDLGEHAERLVGKIEADLQYDETGRSYLKREVVLNLVFRVTDFMRQLSKRI
jgi:hypothetical protein